jgi:hypothetical protein
MWRGTLPALLGALSLAAAVRADPRPFPVEVVNPDSAPLPVAGTVTVGNTVPVSGTVGLASGTQVGISGSVSVSGPVSVTLPSTDTVTLLAQGLGLENFDCFSNLGFNTGAGGHFAVPVGDRLEIDAIYVVFSVKPSATVATAYLVDVSSSNPALQLFLAPTRVGADASLAYYVLSGPLKAYVGAQDTLQINVTSSNGTPAGAYAVLYGRLVPAG